METPYQEIVASDYSQPSLHRDQKLQLECSKNSAVECVESATGSADCLITNNEQKHEHPYVLLANDDENYFKAPCQDSMASDCLLPLLDGVQELESELPKQSDLQCFELFAEASDSLTSKNNQISEESVHDESSKNRKNSYPELSSISCAVQFTDTHLEGSSIEQDIYTSPNAESSKLYHSCEEIVDDGESNCNCPTTDDALSHVTCSNIQHARETDVPLEASSLGKEGGNTSLADPLVAKPDEVAEVPNSNFYKSLTVDALSLGLPSMGTQKEATGSQETLIQLHTGPCTSDPKKLWVKDLNLMKRTHDETLDRSDLWSNNVLSVQDFDLSKMHQQPDLLQRSHGICCVQTEAKDEALTSGVSFIQKRSTNGASIGLDTTSNFSSEMHDRAIVHLRTNLEERNMKNKAIFATENTRVQQAYIRGDKGTLDLISPAFEEEDEEFQIDEEDAVSLRNALLAEKKMLALLETELENERNAAAIATSEAMAMISRLQEEKSTMQLEAAQLQRMAEEKADYDEQAITLLKDLLIKRETEKHALEKELELYREKLMLEKTSIVDKNKDLLVVPFTRSTSERKIVDKNKDLLVVPFTRSTSERKINEVGAAFLLDEENHRQEVVPLVDEVCNSEKTFQKKQSTVHEENAVQPGESTESRRPQNCFVKDVVDTDDEEGSSCCFSRQISGQHHSHHELEVMSESIFTADDDGETRFILERLRVIEEELRELRKLDGERAQWKSSDAEYLNGCSSDRAGPGHIREAEAGLDSGESGHGIVLQLPLHDVYEVQCAPSQERIEIPEETRHPPKDALYHSLAPAMDPQNSGSMTSTIKSFLAACGKT
ncbi:hypothetical protein KP509_30G073300 [Ceratopteris richardii]|uniref:GTD-binding domain-containing protein n=1 Tax=Ceratopteris richardii TaxID=49495 RepID=A0A8T2R5I9_CERRI|nr:hypothetical protein KP509_30G073300 [Ceratopteris richardii]